MIDIASNGQLTRVFDKTCQRDVLARGSVGNQLQAFEDRPISWDAWDIDPDFEDRMDVIDVTGSFEIIESGPIRASINIVKVWRSSTITQTIRLHAHSKRLDVETHIDWHETHALLKVAFPTAVTADTAQYDIQWGQIDRPTTRDTSFDAARFEVPAHKWAMITDTQFGVALLNDCKYGYDVHKHTLRLSLIKSSTSPDPEADQGEHRFTYSLLPIAASERDTLDQSAYDLNAPLRVMTTTQDNVTNVGSFVQSSTPSIIVQTLKPADNARGFVVRLYQSRNYSAETTLSFPSSIVNAEHCSLDEKGTTQAAFAGNTLTIKLGAFEIVTLRIELL